MGRKAKASTPDSPSSSTNGPFQERRHPYNVTGMNTSDHFPGFFTKPTFRISSEQAVLKGSARRALAAFDHGYRFSCWFFPPAALPAERADRPASCAPSAFDASRDGDRLSAAELDRLLERNLLPRLGDESPAPRPRAGFSPEAVELGALLVIVGALLAKLFFG
jgi:hypothetical protein